MRSVYNYISIFAITSILICSCGTTARKLNRIRSKDISANLNLPMSSSTPQLDTLIQKINRDTIRVKMDGHDMVLMKAIKDENGEMVATDVIKPAVVTARFKNVAERHGRVDIQFQIDVPESMLDTKWQLRFFPEMVLLDKTINLEPVYITGKDFRKEQLRGYQQYQKFLNSIITDTTKFINKFQLEIFLKRNLPEIYAFKYNDNYVTDNEFYSYYGITQQMAIEHYTNKWLKRYNNWKIGNKEKMFRKYVKVPIVREGIRLDTLYKKDGKFVYNYTQTINVNKNLKKADVYISGNIQEGSKKIYDIPKTEPLTFYISSVSTLLDNRIKYKTAVIERRVEANASYFIDFELGKSEIKKNLYNNEAEIYRIDNTLRSLVENDSFDLDSVMVRAYASPEGSITINRNLCGRRAESVKSYFYNHVRHFRDSLSNSGFSMDINGNVVKNKTYNIKFLSRLGGENWDKFTEIINNDSNLTEEQKVFYKNGLDIRNLDDRESRLKSNRNFYSYCKDNIFPRLRTVKFDFYLHRKGMVKDTIHTTVVDTAYMKGVEAIVDRDYQRAITFLRSYNDYNTAIAYCALDRNESAKQILESLPKTAKVNYMLAIIYSRLNEPEKAVQCFINACKQERSFINRGNLDPEISALIKTYNLDLQDETYN